MDYISDSSEDESDTHYLSESFTDENDIGDTEEENSSLLSDSSSFDFRNINVALDGTIDLNQIKYDHVIKRMYDFQELVYELNSTNLEQTVQAIIAMRLESSLEIEEVGFYLRTIAAHQHNKCEMIKQLWVYLEKTHRLSKNCRRIREFLPKQNITKAIYCDDSDKLQLICSEPLISIDSFIYPEGFSLGHEISLIQYSALVGSVKCFKFLITNGAKLDPQFYDSMAQFSIIGGEPEIIHELERRFHIEYGHKYLVYAAQYQQNEIFDWIIEHNPGAQDQSVLQACVANHYLHGIFDYQNPNSHLRVNLQFLLENSVRSNFVQLINCCLLSFNFDCSQLLVLACEYKCTTIIGILLSHNAYVDFVTSNDHDSDKHLYLYPPNNFYIQHNVYSKFKSYPLFEAVLAGDAEIVKMLIDSFANPNLLIYFGNCNKTNCLVHACAKGYFEIVKILIDYYKTSVNLPYIQGDHIKTTALLEACRAGQVKIVKLLLKKPDIEVNRILFNDETGRVIETVPAPIAVAIQNDRIKVVELLLAHEKINLSNRYDLITEAIKKENMLLFKLLAKHQKIALNEDDYCYFKYQKIDQLFLSEIEKIIIENETRILK